LLGGLRVLVSLFEALKEGCKIDKIDQENKTEQNTGALRALRKKKDNNKKKKKSEFASS
jgi:hypothetical protein